MENKTENLNEQAIELNFSRDNAAPEAPAPETPAPEAPAPGKAKRRPKKARMHPAVVGVAVGLSVLILIAVGVIISAVVKMQSDAESGVSAPKILVDIGKTAVNTSEPGVTPPEPVEVGGLSREEIVQTLLDSGWDDTHAGSLTVKLPAGVEFQLDYYEAGVSPTAEQMADYVLDYGKGESDAETLRAYIDSSRQGVTVSGPELQLNEDYVRRAVDEGATRFELRTAFGDYTVSEDLSSLSLLKGGGQMILDRDALYRQVSARLLNHETEYVPNFPRESISTPDFNQLYQQVHVDPTDAYFALEFGQVRLVPETEGITFDVDEARRLWEAAELAEEVTIPLSRTVPAIKESDLDGLLFRDKLGEKKTFYWGSSAGRIGNISLVAQKVNGLVLMPGDQFSFNGFIGQRTAEGGFQAAPAYDNGKVTYEIGGGICQTSSTLYFAVLMANLQVDDPTCHQFEVNYLPRGLDATVSWPAPDFKFTNNRDYPIRIDAVSDERETSITFTIWGTNVDGTYVEPVSSWWAWYDTKHPSVQIGWKAVSFRNLYDADGNLLEQIEESYSEYNFHGEDIKWPEETPKPTEKPAETPKPTNPPAETPAPQPTPEPQPEPTPEPQPEPEPEPGGGEDEDPDVVVTG